MNGILEIFREPFLNSQTPFARPYLDDLIQRARSFLIPRSEEMTQSAETLLEWFLDGAIDPDTEESILDGNQRDRAFATFTQARNIQEFRTIIDLSGVTFIPGLTWKELLGIFAQERLFQLYALGRMADASGYEWENDPTIHHSFDDSVLVREATEAVIFGELEEHAKLIAKTILSENLARAGSESHRRARELRALVVARYKEKYSTASYRSAAKRIFESLIEENVIVWRDGIEVYQKGRLVLSNQDPFTTFERWIAAHAKAGGARPQS